MHSAVEYAKMLGFQAEQRMGSPGFLTNGAINRENMQMFVYLRTGIVTNWIGNDYDSDTDSESESESESEAPPEKTNYRCEYCLGYFKNKFAKYDHKRRGKCEVLRQKV